jgi:hypothetical protein
MEVIKKVKEISIGVILIVCALGFVILLGFSVYNLYKTLAPTWTGPTTDMPSIYGTCGKFKDVYVVSVTISNYNRELKNIKCKLVSKGGMTADKEEEALSILSPNSTDFCEFYLTGEPLSPVRVRVTYSMKFLTGYKEYSTIVEPYPPCSPNEKPVEGY